MTVFLLALAMRLPLLPDQPRTDEGINAAAAYFHYLAYTGQLAAPGWVLPRDGHVFLYPLLGSWAFMLPFPAFLSLRLLDAVVAAAAGVGFHRFLRLAVDSRAALIGALLFVLLMNQPLFVESGFKNSIMPALLLQSLALALLYRGGSDRAWIAAGALTAPTVLLREFFLPMAAVVGLYAAWRSGARGLLRFVLGAAASGGFLLVLLVLLRGPGGFAGLVDSYVSYATEFVPGRTALETAQAQGLLAASRMLPALPLVLLGLATPLLSVRERFTRWPELYALGVALTLCPALEIWLKPAYPYHFAQSTIGLCLLAALGAKVMLVLAARPPAWRLRALAAVLCMATLAALKQPAQNYGWYAASASRFFSVMVLGDWNSPAVESSLYLRAAHAVRKHTPQGATMITPYVSAGLIPLSGRLPSAVGMGSLSRARQTAVPQRQQGVVQEDPLLASPPDVLLLVPRTPQAAGGEDAYTRALVQRYERVVRQGPGLSPYGAWSAEIYLRRPA